MPDGDGGQGRRARARGALCEVFAELKQVRRDGIALDSDKYSSGISALGTAFRDPMGAVYAVSIPEPSSRISGRQRALAEALLAARSKIVAALT